MECTATSSSESPPRSKKLSSSPTFGTFRMRCQSWRACALAGCREAPPLGAYLWELSSRAAKALRSTFPCSESGSEAAPRRRPEPCGEAAETRQTRAILLWARSRGTK